MDQGELCEAQDLKHEDDRDENQQSQNEAWEHLKEDILDGFFSAENAQD